MKTTVLRWRPSRVMILIAAVVFLGAGRCGRSAASVGAQQEPSRARGEVEQEPEREQEASSRRSRVKTLKRGGGRHDWCAEDDLIAYDIKGEDDFFDVHAMKPDGSEDRCLTCDVPGLPRRNVGQPAWHPSCRYLLVQAEKQEHEKVRFEFVLSPGAGVLNDLWLVDLEKNRAHLLREVGNERDQGTLHAHFSKDGKKLSWSEMYESGGFKKGQELGYWKLMVANFSIEDGDPELSNIRSFAPQGDGFYENHGFSPDGSKIIFTSNADAKRFSNDIFVMDLSSGRETKLTDGGHNEHARFSPDGKHIVWMSNEGNDNRGTDYWLMNADGSNKRRLTFFNKKGSADYVGQRMIVADVSWSPDGRTLAAYRRVGRGVVPDKDDSEIVTVDVSEAVSTAK